MKKDKNRKEKTFPEVLELLASENERFLLIDLSGFSNISSHDLGLLRATWPNLSVARKIYLFEGLYLHAQESYVADYSGMGFFGVEDPDPKVRRYALGLLFDCRMPSFIDLVLTLADKDPDFEVRQTAIEILGQLMIDLEMEDLPLEAGRKALRFLESLKNDPDRRIRWGAMEALAFANHALVPEMVQAALASAEEAGVVSALRAIQHTMQKRWEDTVLEYLDHPNPSVQTEAINAAGLIPVRKARKVILKLLTEFDTLDNDVLCASILAISQIGGGQVAEVIDELSEVYEDDEEMQELFDQAKDNLETAAFVRENFTDAELKEFFDLEKDEDEFSSDEEDDDSEEDYVFLIQERIAAMPEVDENEEHVHTHLHHSHDHEHEEDDEDDLEELDWDRFRIIDDISAEDEFLDDEDADWSEDEE